VKRRLRHLPASLVASAVLLVVGVPLGGVFAGGAGAAGVAAGVTLVVFSYLVSSLVVAWVDLVARHLLLAVGLLTYVLKFTAFGVAMYSVWQTGWAGLTAMGISVIVATVVWTGTQLWWILTAKIPYVELDA
jgi:ATP synthase protein I